MARAGPSAQDNTASRPAAAAPGAAPSQLGALSPHPAHPGRPAPSKPLGETAPSDERPARRPALQAGAPILRCPPRSRGGASPLPRRPRPALGPPCREAGGLGSHRDTLASRSVPQRPVRGWAGRTGLTCFMYMVPRPSPGRTPPEKRQRGRGVQ